MAYFVLDIGGCTGTLPAGRNRMAELIRLARSRGPDEMAATYAGVVEWLSGPEHEGFVRALWEWLRRVLLPAHGLDVELPPLKNWREAGTVLQKSVTYWTVSWREQGRAKGVREGIERGLDQQRTLIGRLVATKFGAQASARAEPLLARIAGPERLAEVGEWLLECEHGDELLDRVAGLCATSAPGDGPSRG